MLEQTKNLQQFVPGAVLTPEQKLKLIEDKVKRAEAYLKSINQQLKKLPKR